MKTPRDTPVETLDPLGKTAATAGERVAEQRPDQVQSRDEIVWDPNAPETEEDGIRAEAVRRLKVRRMFSRGDESPK